MAHTSQPKEDCNKETDSFETILDQVLKAEGNEKTPKRVERLFVGIEVLHLGWGGHTFSDWRLQKMMKMLRELFEIFIRSKDPKMNLQHLILACKAFRDLLQGTITANVEVPRDAFHMFQAFTKDMQQFLEEEILCSFSRNAVAIADETLQVLEILRVRISDYSRHREALLWFSKKMVEMNNDHFAKLLAERGCTFVDSVAAGRTDKKVELLIDCLLHQPLDTLVTNAALTVIEFSSQVIIEFLALDKEQKLVKSKDCLLALCNAIKLWCCREPIDKNICKLFTSYFRLTRRVAHSDCATVELVS